jgi:hypothetical protein
VFRIARRVAKDRGVSTVDPDARHGHKTAARGFDGYKGHAATDPDSEIITATTVIPGNAGNASVAEDLIADLLDKDTPEDEPTGAGPADEQAPDESSEPAAHDEPAEHGRPESDDADAEADTATVYGDNAYGTREFQERLEGAGIGSRCKTQKPTTAGGLFTKDDFTVDLGADTVTCAAGNTAPIHRACASCPLRAQCTTAASGRTIRVSTHERSRWAGTTRTACERGARSFLGCLTRAAMVPAPAHGGSWRSFEAGGQRSFRGASRFRVRSKSANADEKSPVDVSPLLNVGQPLLAYQMSTSGRPA